MNFSPRAIIAAFVFPIMVSSSISALAQDKGQDPEWTSGGVQDVQIEIVGTKELRLPTANRNFEKIPPRPSEPIKPPIRYDFQAFNFSAPAIKPQIRPLKLKAASQSDINSGYVRAGYGNYGSPLLEGYITSGKDKNKLIGAHLYHFSSAKGPVDGTNSGSGNSRASVFARTFSENLALSANVDLENRSTHFYGYPDGFETEPKDIKQVYNLLRLAGELSNAQNSDFSYKLGALFSRMTDKYDAAETEANIIFNSGYRVNDNSRFNIDVAYAMISRKDAAVSAKVRNLLTISPTFSFSPVEDLKLKIGVGIAYENDTLDSKDLHIYPNVNASYPVSPSVDLVAAFTGSMEKVSLQTLSYKNIWIGPNIPIYHTNKYYELSFGMNAKLGNKVGASAGISNAAIKNMHFFVNGDGADPLDQAKFDVVYDPGFFVRTNVFGSLSYAQSEKLKLMLRGDVFSYGTDKVDEAWHMPRYKLNANASFNVAQKLILGFDVIGMGGMKGLDPETGDAVKLDGAMDLNAKAEYLFSKSLSLFVQFNNIAGSNYPLYLNYPVRGFQVLGGFTWSF